MRVRRGLCIREGLLFTRWLHAVVNDALLALRQVRVARRQAPGDCRGGRSLLGLPQAYNAVVLRLAQSEVTVKTPCDATDHRAEPCTYAQLCVQD